MAGKPEPPQSHIQHHQQQANVQNVVVYVSNDNFAAQAYATAVNQHNVSASYPQQQSQQNGATAATFAPSTQSVAPLGAPIKNLKPPLIKTQDFPTSNGLIGNVSLPQQASFYASTNTPGGIVQTNGFHHGHGSNVINNIAYSSNNVGHSGAILNQGFGSGTSVKGLVNLGGHPGIGQQQAVCPNSIELPSAVIGSSNEQICNGYSVVPQPSQAIVQQQQQQQRVAVSCAQTFFSGPDQKNNAHNEAGGNSSSASQALATTNFITTTQGGDAANIVAVMGGDGGATGSSTPSSGAVVFPRCDSVRSETAESSCSSLSSGDSQPDAGTNSLTLLLPPSAGHPVAPMNNPHLVTSGSNSLVHQSPTTVPPGLNNAAGMVMLNNGVNVQQSGAQAAGIVRTPGGAISLSQQQLGNIVLAMAVPPNAAALNNNNMIQQTNQPVATSVPVQPVVPTITVPFGWKRLHINGAIVYISPSNTALSSLDHLKEYLQTQGTCKCGLECPLKCDTVFNFDPKVATRPWAMPPSDSTVTSADLTKLCNHKRKLLAMATLAAGPGFNSQQQQQLQQQTHGAQGSADAQLPKVKKDGRNTTRKKPRIPSTRGFSGVSVSQLLAQRERGLTAGTPPQGKEPAGRAPQNWSGGPSPTGTNQLPSSGGPQIPNRPQFPPPNFTSDPNIIQGVNSSPQFLRYSTPNGGVPPAILGGNIMVHPNASPLHLNNLTQQQQNLIGQPVMNVPPNSQQHNPVLEHSSAQSGNSAGNPHQSEMVTNGNAAVLPGNTVMSNNNTASVMVGGAGNQVVMSAGGMMVHGGGNPSILCQPQQRVPPLSGTPDEMQNASACGNNKQQHVMYSGVINSSGSSQTSQDLHMLRMQQQQQFYGQQNQYQVQQPRLEDQNKVMLQQQQQQQQQPSMVQNSRQPQQHQQFVPVSCNNGTNISGPAGVFVDQYNRGQQVVQQQQQQQSQQQQQHQNIVQMQQQQHHQMVSSGPSVNPPGSGGGVMMMHQQRAPPWQQQNRNANNTGAGTTMITMHQQHHSPVVTPTPQSNTLPPPNSYDRVPPLHHHTPPPPVWTEEVSRKKPKGSGKSGSSARKQRPYNILEHHQHHRIGVGGMPGNAGSTPMDSHAPCPNIDVRQIPLEHNRPPPSHPNSDNSNPTYVAGNNPNIPSFMEDPSGYLAQQTALLNSTISRQTGVGGPNFMCHSPVRNPEQQVSSPQSAVVNLPTSCSSPATVGVPLPSNVLLPAPKGTSNFSSRASTNIPVQQSNLNTHTSIQNPVAITSHHTISSPIPTTTVATSPYNQPQGQGSAMLGIGMPDSSALSDQRVEMGSHCQGCVVSSGSLLPVSSSGNNVGENMLFHHQIHQQIQQQIMQPDPTNINPGNQRVHTQQSQQQQQQQQQQQHANMSTDFKMYHGQHNSGSTPNDTMIQHSSNSGTPTPNIIQEDNPVTSSTFDRLGNPVPQRHQIPMPSDSRGPIQGGTVSTSNGSPVETYSLPQPEASPTSSTPTSSQSCRMPDTSSTSNNVYISSSSSSSSPFTVPNVSPPGLYSYPNPPQGHFQAPRNENVPCSSPGASNPPVVRQHPNRSSDNYCHHVHDQTRAQKFAVQSTTMVTTMASGHTVSSNTITSVLAGKANTATVSVGNPSAPTANTPPSSMLPVPPVYTSQAAMMTIPQSSVSIPAGHSQGMQVATVSKSPLEMVQSVVSSIQVPQQQQNMMTSGNGVQTPQQPQQHQQQQQQQAAAILKPPGAPPGLPPGHILVSSGGQLIMANTGNVMTPPGATAGLMAPPPQPPPPHSMAKLVSHSSMPPMSVSPMVTSVTAAVTQVIPAVGVAQQVLGQPTVLVNALPAPLLIQPSVMTVDGMAGLNQNAMQIPHLAVATGNVIHHSQGPNSAGNGIGQLLDSMNQDHPGSRNNQTTSGYVRHTPQQPSLLSPPEMSHHAASAPGSVKKKGGKKRKVPQQTVASMLHIASQQNSPAAAATATATGIVMQQQQQQNFPQQSFTMSGPHQSIATTGPMLQALTIVPGKAGAPAQILMNGQPGTTTGHFGTQQLIAAPATSQPPQQINLLQPVNLLNGAAGVVQNFPTFQQFIVPSLGGMVMATDGTTTLLPDATNLGVQLQLQNVNGQNVLTPVQSHGGTAVFGHPTGQSILAAGPAGMVIRTPTTGGKMTTGPMLQQQNSGGPQFLASSPTGGQFLMNGTAAFGGQLSPLVANVSPNQQMSFTTNTSPVRTNQGTHQPQQEFIQCGQMGQTLMVPCTVPTSQNHQNTTVVQQNTTIVQQQTTMVSNNQQLGTTPQNFAGNNTSNTVASATTLNVNQQNFIVGSSTTQCVQDKMQPSPIQQSNISVSSSPPPPRQTPLMMKHSVSTQTAVNQSVQASSSPSVTPGSLVVTTNSTFCQTSTAVSSGGSPPDTTTHSPVDPGGGGSSGSSDGRPQTPSADTTTHSTGVGSTDDGLSSPSPSSCPVTGSCGGISANGENIQVRQQSSGVTASPMPMVHCVSSSNEQDTSGIGDQAEYDWGSVSSGKGIFVSPTVTEGGFNSNASSPHQTEYSTKYVGGDVIVGVTGTGHLMCESERRRSVNNMYVESSTVAGLSAFSGNGSGELLSKQQQEAIVSSRQIFEYNNNDERRVLPRSSVNPKLCSSSSNVGLVAAVAERGIKRKHSDALVVLETHPHDIHSMEEDDEGAVN
ncbi:nuclear receptor coactivator 6-like isoform X2 [Periplaneta americana]|uniref:nuclear receptor coactivator 6-like isoform X2 n=1 Tax=Periplaneta americana TaxID=6978 RepID=UPI0037E83063